MEDTRKQFIEAVKQGTHILVTVKSSPSIDQLASCIALTVLLNELGKRATAVFSGKVPSTIEFLKPGKMLQHNTDSLQDFIIALDKSKADKLRYKVEDTMVKIYITPYQTSITDKDLQYSKGDFNVDVVIALGAHSQAELDRAITSHGRILHDATIVSMNTSEGPVTDLGSINWIDSEVSSLSEMIANAVEELASDKKDALDNQIATALLTGIVSETESFGNSKTTPATMEVAAHLLSAGANQELVATKLSGPLKHDLAMPGGYGHDAAPHGRKHKGQHGAKAAAGVVAVGDSDGTQSDGKADGKSDEKDGKDKTADIPASSKPVDDSVTATPIAHPDPEIPDVPVDIIDQPETPETSSLSDSASETVSSSDDSSPTSTDAESADSTSPDSSDSPLVGMTESSESDATASDSSGSSAADTGATDTAILGDAADELAPKVYDLNKISIPASIPASPAEEAAQAEASAGVQPAAVPEDDILATLSKQEEADPNQMQPLRDQNGFVNNPPLHERAMNAAQEGSSESVDSTLDATKFAVTPPTLGGRLTANHDPVTLEPPSNPLSEAAVNTHHSMMTHGAPGAPGSDNDKPADNAAPAASDTPVEMHHEKKLVVPTSSEPEKPESTPADNLAALLAAEAQETPSSSMGPNPMGGLPVNAGPGSSPMSVETNELAALGIIQPGGSGSSSNGMQPLDMPVPAGIAAAPAPGFAPGPPPPVGSAPPLVPPPMPTSPFVGPPR